MRTQRDGVTLDVQRSQVDLMWQRDPHRHSAPCVRCMERCDAHAHAAGPQAGQALLRGCACRERPSELRWQEAGVGGHDPRTTSQAGQLGDEQMGRCQCCRLITMACLPTRQETWLASVFV